MISIDYSLSPEVQHPVALEECFDTLEWVLNQGNALLRANTSKIAVVGDSAGGNLAAALCCKYYMILHDIICSFPAIRLLHFIHGCMSY